MPKKRTSKVVKNDFEYDEGEVCGFTSEVPTDGNCISSFSFDDDSDVKDFETNSKSNIDTISSSNTNNQNSITDSIRIKNPRISTKEIFDNRRTPLPNGAAPAIDGETPTIKRSYTLRSSTIRKINELKSIHPDINVCVSTIVDIAIDCYYNHIVNEGGNQ